MMVHVLKGISFVLRDAWWPSGTEARTPEREVGVRS